MKRLYRGPVWFVWSLVLALILGACSLLPGGGSGDLEADIEAQVAATLTKEAWLGGVESARQTAIASEEAAQAEEGNAESAEPTEAPPPETPTPEPSLTPTVAHLMRPGEPLEVINSHVTDPSSLGFAAEGHTYGDQYLINRFERPFTAETMEYKGYLDILLTDLKYNAPWVYFIIKLQEDLPGSAEARYGIEFDLDIDGRGDVLVTAALPAGGEWTTDGVRVHKDIDGDVGGENPVFSEAPLEGLTGYEVEIFNSGQGEDPDLAWIRRDPEEPNRVQLAVKDSLVGGTGYLWSVWADEGVQDPAARDYNDRWTLSVAGSPILENQFYPLKDVALVDSTCRSWYGYEPTGAEPGLCQMAGSGQGWKVCITYFFSNSTYTECSNVCQEKCPDLPPDPPGIQYSCEPCKIP